MAETTLLDLKHLLLEAKQRVPKFLLGYKSEMERFLGAGGVAGCSYCGGPGHRITECPKRESLAAQTTARIGRSDFINDNGFSADY